MEEINLKDLWTYFINKIYILVLIVIACVTVVVIYAAFIEKPVYESSATMVLTGVNSTGNESINQNDVTMNQKLVSSYREIIKSRKILDQVISNLNLNLTYEELSQMINVVNIDDTELLKITVKSEDPYQAQDVANQITEVFSKEIKEIYNIENVTTIDTAELPTSSSNKSVFKQTLYGIIVGIVVGCAVIFVMFRFDTTIKSEKDIEDAVGLSVIGTVNLSHRNFKEAKK